MSKANLLFVQGRNFAHYRVVSKANLLFVQGRDFAHYRVVSKANLLFVQGRFLPTTGLCPRQTFCLSKAELLSTSGLHPRQPISTWLSPTWATINQSNIPYLNLGWHLNPTTCATWVNTSINFHIIIIVLNHVKLSSLVVHKSYQLPNF